MQIIIKYFVFLKSALNLSVFQEKKKITLILYVRLPCQKPFSITLTNSELCIYFILSEILLAFYWWVFQKYKWKKKTSLFLSDLQEQESVATKIFGDQALVAENDIM